MATDTEAKVHNILGNLRSLDKARELFAELNYDPAHDLLTRSGWSRPVADALAEDPQVMACHDDFKIIYARLNSDRLLLGDERPVVNRLLQEHPYLLCLFSDRQQQQWHFVNIKYDEEIKKRRLFRRITVGPDERLRTATERLSQLDLERIRPDLAGIYPLDIQQRHDKAFDVEVVTKEFYNTFVDLFHQLKDEIASNNPTYRDEAPIEAQMILNRLLFLYFIQKKRWLDNNPHYLYERFQEHYAKNPSGYTFYSDFLIRLFQRLSNEQLEFKDLGDVPFLNGGLFEIEPFHSKLPFDLKISNRTFRDVFDSLLEHFNFTVREDTPVDVEVAIDPEMLGRIFENLILQLEKDRDLRKMTGSYYTPRVIVHFMCQQSLKEYLALESQIDPAKLEMLLELNPPDQLEDWEVDLLKDIVSIPEARTLRDAAKRVFVLDPAVGSGAFLVGMLHEVLTLIKHMDIREHGPEYIARRNYAYELKRDIIESCLYGVDILEQAVRICELRLWLSLVVDYEKEPEEEVPPLPNLSYQVRQGDSLIETLFGQRVRLDTLTRTEKGRQLIDEIQQEKHAYFLTRNLRQKRQKELNILVKQCELSEILVKEKKQTLGTKQRLFGEMIDKEAIQSEEVRKQAATFDNLLHSAQKAKQKAQAWIEGKLAMSSTDIDRLRKELGISFIWRLDFAEVFKEKAGFDVVIANPPYVEHKKLRDIRPLLVNYETYSGTADLYVYFYEKGMALLKKGGVLSFISSNKFFKTSYGANLRSFLTSYNIRRIIDFTNIHIFDALVATCIMIVSKESRRNRILVSMADDNIESHHDISQFLYDHHLQLESSNLNSDIWQLDNSPRLSLKSRIENGSTKLCDSRSIHIYRGVTTGCNDAFIIDEATRAAIIREDTSSRDVIVPLLQGRDIRRWYHKKCRSYLLHTGYDLNVPKKHPEVFSHLCQYKTTLVQRADQGKNWWNLRACAYYDEFKKEKIIWGLTADKWAFSYDDEGHYLPSNGYILTSSKTSIKYLLAILNSYLMEFYFGFIGIMTAGGAFTLKHETIRELPIKALYSTEEKPFISLVDQILAITKDEDYLANPTKQARVKEYKRQIDQMVYELYELTPAEITVIESAP